MSKYVIILISVISACALMTKFFNVEQDKPIITSQVIDIKGFKSELASKYNSIVDVDLTESDIGLAAKVTLLDFPPNQSIKNIHGDILILSKAYQGLDFSNLEVSVSYGEYKVECEIYQNVRAIRLTLNRDNEILIGGSVITENYFFDTLSKIPRDCSSVKFFITLEEGVPVEFADNLMAKIDKLNFRHLYQPSIIHAPKLPIIL